jgi:hypothetical protein
MARHPSVKRRYARRSGKAKRSMRHNKSSGSGKKHGMRRWTGIKCPDGINRPICRPAPGAASSAAGGAAGGQATTVCTAWSQCTINPGATCINGSIAGTKSQKCGNTVSTQNCSFQCAAPTKKR